MKNYKILKNPTENHQKKNLDLKDKLIFDSILKN